MLSTPQSIAAIDKLIEPDHLVFFYGSGLGAEAGLPSWATLIERLLVKAIEHVAENDTGAAPFFPSEEHQSIAAKIIAAEGPLPAATLARARLSMLGGRTAFQSALRECLYRRSGDEGAVFTDANEFEPGPLSRTLARTVKTALTAGKRVQLFTTNYDPLTFKALSDELGTAYRLVRISAAEVANLKERGEWKAFLDRDFSVVPDYEEPAAEPPRIRVPVVFLHGYVLPGDTDDVARSDAPIFSEAEYIKESSESGWQEELLGRWLKDKGEDEGEPKVAALFLGTGLNDPDILRTLFKFAHLNCRGVFALRPRQRVVAADSVDVPVVCEPEEQLHEDFSLARWADAKVTVLPHDYYYEQSAFLRELSARLADPETVDHVRRTQRWYDEFCLHRLTMVPFVASEESVEAAARRRAVFLEKNFEAERDLMNRVRERIDRRSREVMSDLQPGKPWFPEPNAIHLWSVYPPEHSLAMTFASDRVWKDPCAIDRRAIWKPTNYTALDAFCDGDARARDFSDSVDQFGMSLAVPIVLDQGEFSGLQVGACVLASTLGADASVTWRAIKGDAGHRRWVVEQLQELGRRLLTPVLEVDTVDLRDGSSESTPAVEQEHLPEE